MLVRLFLIAIYILFPDAVVILRTRGVGLEGLFQRDRVTKVLSDFDKVIARTTASIYNGGCLTSTGFTSRGGIK